MNNYAEELFLSALSRFPTQEERRASLAYMKMYGARQPVCIGILWALIDTTEFIFNH